ncbi:MAG TPA: hypothetical protein VFD91_03110 [Mariniphaga sp.]|nr:hypothetical protein [Mariniphaga sp.]
MNIFAHIERLDDFQFNVVKYYSVYLEVDGEVNDVNEFFDFLNRMEDIEEIEDDLSNLLVWIEEIGENFGADKNRFFRNESITADVQALPPPAKQMQVYEIPVENLRLYCLVLNRHVVFLFNGGIKTTHNAKNCPNVGTYIKRANKIACQIDVLLKENEITWNFDHTDIEFDEKLEFEL